MTKEQYEELQSRFFCQLRDHNKYPRTNQIIFNEAILICVSILKEIYEQRGELDEHSANL